MWPLRLWDTQEVALFISITLYVCHVAGAISIRSPQKNLIRSVQEDVLFSVDISCHEIPTIHWTYMSGSVSRSIGAWQPRGFINVTMDYRDRVHTHTNGSMGLSDLRLQDAGYYVITVTEQSGSSKDAGFILKVNEVLYEDLQYLSVFAAVLSAMAGFLMASMWLMDKAYHQLKACRRRRQMPEHDETELQPL